MTDIDNGRITDRGWEFSDKVTFKVLDYDQQSFEKVQDDYPGAFKPQTGGTPHPSGLGTVPNTGQQISLGTDTSVQGRGLVVRIAATHSGLITRNNGFYLPDKMRDGAKTFIDLYPKPIQVHHEDHKDPVGRVLASRYVETVGAVIDRFKNTVLRDSRKKDVGRADKDFFKDFCGSDKSFIEKLQMIKLMDNVLSDKHYRGVGFIELTSDITDPDAIKKVLDGRFLTGSVGAVSDKAVCSICNTNWLEEEHCGHRPGKPYEDKKCFIVAGNLEYDEYSFVNTPADRHSGVLSIEANNLLDSVKNRKDNKHLFFYPVTDYFHKEDSAMENITTATDPEVEVQDESQSSDTGGTDSASKKDAEVGTDVKDAVETSAESETQTETTTDTEIKLEDGDTLSPLLDKVLSVKEGSKYDFDLTPEEVNALYDALAAELPEGARLTPEQQSKLPKSSFCGPSRSFPVPDSAHITAIRNLLDKLSTSAEKSSLSAAVARKAKAIGYVAPVKSEQVKDAVVADEQVAKSRLTADVITNVLTVLDTGLYGNPWDSETADLSSLIDEENNILRMMISELVKRIGKDNLEAALVSEGLLSNKDELDAQLTEATRLEDELGDKNDQLNALRQELRATYTDVANLTDSLINANAKVRSEKVERAVTLHTLDGSFTDELKGDLFKLSDEVLDNALKTLSGKVDTSKIAAKVNDGLSRTPKENIEDPTTEVTTPFVTEETPNLVDNKPTFQTQDRVDQEYRRILVNLKNPTAANAFYKDAVKKGLASPRPGLDS